MGSVDFSAGAIEFDFQGEGDGPVFRNPRTRLGWLWLGQPADHFQGEGRPRRPRSGVFF